MRKVLLADEYELFRFALSKALGSHPEITVVGECGTYTEVEDKVSALKPDVVITELRMSDRRKDIVKRILELSPHSKVLVLTSVVNDSEVCEAISHGVHGYLLKHVGVHDLVRAVEKVSKGEPVLDPALTSIVMRKVKNQSIGEPIDALTLQEQRILLFVAEGKTNRQIGSLLALSENTVKNYISVIFNKCGFHNRAEAAAYAAKYLA